MDLPLSLIGESAASDCTLHIRCAANSLPRASARPHDMGFCPSDNTEGIDQSTFLDGHTLHWDAHRIGWTIAGSCTVVVIPYVLPPAALV